MLGIGCDVAYREAKSGNLGGVPVIKLGKKLVVSLAALERVLASETLPGRKSPGADGTNANPAVAAGGESGNHQTIDNAAILSRSRRPSAATCPMNSGVLSGFTVTSRRNPTLSTPTIYGRF